MNSETKSQSVAEVLATFPGRILRMKRLPLWRRKEYLQAKIEDGRGWQHGSFEREEVSALEVAIAIIDAILEHAPPPKAQREPSLSWRRWAASLLGVGYHTTTVDELRREFERRLTLP